MGRAGGGAPGLLHQFFHASVDRVPDGLALDIPPALASGPDAGQARTTLTYTQLRHAVIALAARLHTRLNTIVHSSGGVPLPAEPIVALCMPRRNPLLLALQLAVLELGLAYTCLDVSAPPERLSFVVEDSHAVVVVADPAYSSVLRAAGIPASLLMDEPLSITSLTARGAGMPPVTPIKTATPTTLCYVIYTSGTTGKPKGVCIQHTGVCSQLKHFARRPGFTASDVLLSLTMYSFDPSILEMFLPLTVGGKLVIASKEVYKDPTAVVALLEASSATYIHSTPSMFRAMVTAGWPVNNRRKLTITIGGEALPMDLASELLERGCLWNVYGPTEGTIWVSALNVTEKDVCPKISIGSPIANMRLYVLDEHLRQVPFGVVGEIHLSGIGIARGYWKLPELTSAKFVANPLCPNADRPLHAVLYKTGDWGKFLEGGQLVYCGRFDNQVKIRGNRIELSEIESVMCEVAGVAQAVVTVHQHNDEPVLVGYYTCVSTTHGDTEEFRDSMLAHLESLLTSVMVPRHLLYLDTMPLNPNGKIDRTRMPKVDLRFVGAKTRCFVAPRDALEHTLAGIWQSVLGVSTVSVNDCFFALGGHSFLAVRLLAQLEQEFGVRLPLSQLLKDATVASVAALLRGERLDVTRAVVTLTSAGERPPLFFVHPAGGVALFFVELCRHMGRTRPFHAIEDPSIYGVVPPFDTLPAMARFYVDQLEEAYPEGPFALGGFCYGGVVAYEMAHMLRERGRAVSAFVMIDSQVTLATYTVPDTLRHFIVQFSKIARLPPAADLPSLTEEELWERACSVGVHANFAPAGSIRDYIARFVAYFRTHVNLQAAHTVTGSLPDLPAVFLHSSEQHYLVPQTLAQWRQHCPLLEAGELAGSHLSMMFEPYVQAVAARLTAFLDRQCP